MLASKPSKSFVDAAPESTTMDLPRDWSEFFRLFNSHRVRYLVVGAHALAANGRPRATADLASEIEAFATLDRMATLGQPPLRIVVMTSITGVTFEEAWRTRKAGKMGRHRVSFLGKDALIRNKRAAGRPKDLLDIALLEEGEPPRRTRRAAATPATSSKAKAKAKQPRGQRSAK